VRSAYSILVGVERALELERELGVRTVEMEAPPAKRPRVSARPPEAPRAAPPPAAPKSAPPERAKRAEMVFLADRALSPKAAEMMAKAIAALGFDQESAPIVHEGRPPAAAKYVALGYPALKKWAPGRQAAMGQWTKTAGGRDVMLVNSPEAIVRFSVATPAVDKMKRELWLSLKAAKERKQA